MIERPTVVHSLAGDLEDDADVLHDLHEICDDIVTVPEAAALDALADLEQELGASFDPAAGVTLAAARLLGVDRAADACMVTSGCCRSVD